MSDTRNPSARPEVDAGSQALSEALHSSFAIVKFVMVILVAVFLASGFFTVGPTQQGMILRFGRPLAHGQQALLGPGLHWSLPYPIDESVIVSIAGAQQVKSTIGYFAITPVQEASGQEPSAPFGTPLDPVVDGYLLTADTNIIHARATLTYRIVDPVRYVFSFVNASNTVQNALDNALLGTAARFPVDEILTRDVIRFKEAVRKRAAEIIKDQDLGILVEDLVVDRSRPPRQLQEAFEAVVKAEVKRTEVLKDARGYENRILSRAEADASSRVERAKAESVMYVNDISSRAKQFQDLLPKYKENPGLFVQQRLTETLGRVLTNVQDKIFLTESADGNTKELRLMLNRDFPKLKSEENKP